MPIPTSGAPKQATAAQPAAAQPAAAETNLAQPSILAHLDAPLAGFEGLFQQLGIAEMPVRGRLEVCLRYLDKTLLHCKLAVLKEDMDATVTLTAADGTVNTFHSVNDYLKSLKGPDGVTLVSADACRDSVMAIQIIPSPIAKEVIDTVYSKMVAERAAAPTILPASQQVCLPVDGMALASDVQPLFFEDFIALNGKLFADVVLPFNKEVRTGKINVVMVKGTAILVHFHVAMMYFPFVFNSDVTRQMREDYDALTVATLILAFYHDDGKGLVANAAVAVDKTKLRELFKLWLELNPQLDDFLIASVWDTLDECVFSA
ncbi:hypothetical protein MN608_03955 [Microdochium nivale]|nr:hypothetical protein MN608_03955 [Microdochium nivale]